MEIRLLGPFVATDSTGEPVALPAAERALLTRLAVAGGRTVSSDRLIDDLWPHGLPADPLNALQVRISKVRRALPGLVVSDPPGYRLDGGVVVIDSMSFAEHIAAQRFAAALELWRGPPLEDLVDQDWARAEAARLTELRAHAVEEQVELRLAAGEHDDLVADLQAALAGDPLRERLRGQLMLALHRSGRTSEALAVYQEGYRLLDSSFGLQPSAHLQRLQEGILRQDAELDPVDQPERQVGNVPSQLTSFLGRNDDVARVSNLLADRRLVTLVGPGGAGKTTLALTVARRVEADHRDGAWLVRLADVRQGTAVIGAIARALGLPEGDPSSTLPTVARWLAPRQVLLVLDNCEHVVDASAQVVEALLQAAGPALRILATSREALGVPGEIQVPVGPLPLDVAVALFRERSSAAGAVAGPSGDRRRTTDVGGSGHPTPDVVDDDAEVRAICERLDRMPLAIELAAARAKVLTPAQILARLDDRFHLLSGGSRTADQRHQTLRAVVEWSHDLLAPPAQVLLRQLSVFAGGWTLEAAEAVCGHDGLPVLDLLGRLVDQSLITAADGRFGMLETIRSFGDGLLAEDPEAADLRRRHARYFTAVAEQAAVGLCGVGQRGWLERLHRDDANLTVALDWTAVHGDVDPELGLRLASALGWYWYVGRQVDGRRHLTLALAAAPARPGVPRARALQSLSLALRPAGCIVHPHAAAGAAARESAAMFTALGLPGRAALSAVMAAVEGIGTRDPQPHREACAAARDVLADDGDPWGVALADFVEMELLLHAGDLDGAMAPGRRAGERFDRLADDWGRSAVRLHLGIALRLAGRLAAAEEVLRDVMALSREGDLPNNLARSLVELAEVALHRGDPADAEDWLAQAELVARVVPDDATQGLIGVARGTVARLRGEWADAAARYAEGAERFAAAEAPAGRAAALVGRAAALLDGGAAGSDWSQRSRESTGHDDTVGELLRAARDAAEVTGDIPTVAGAMEQQARGAAMQGDVATAMGLLDRASDLRARHWRPRTVLQDRDVAEWLPVG